MKPNRLQNQRILSEKFERRSSDNIETEYASNTYVQIPRYSTLDSVNLNHTPARTSPEAEPKNFFKEINPTQLNERKTSKRVDRSRYTDRK